MRKRSYALLQLLLVTTMVVVLASCGPGTTTAPPEPTEEEAPAATTPPEEPTPAEEEGEGEGEEEVVTDNIGVYAVAGDMPSLDPPYMLAEDTNIGFNAYETLTLWDPAEGVVPVLATSWDSNEDATEWIFTLREGVTFHDGSELTAEDVKASLDRNIEVGMVAYDFIGIESIEVVDDYQVRFICSEPRNMPLILTAQYGMFIYSAEAAEQTSEWFAEGQDAGSGPYTIESYEPGDRIVLTQYEDYWGGWEEDQFTKVVYEMVEDPTVREQMIRSGEADITFEIPFDSIEGLQGVEGITVLPFQPLAHLVAAFDLANAPLDNVQVRQALAYSFPYEDVHEGVFLGYGRIPKGFGPTSLWDPPEDFPRYEHDLEQARQLLDEAGYGDGFELDLGLQIGAKETLDVAELWQAELAQLGVDLNIEQLSGSAFWEYAYTPDQEDFHMLMVPASGDVPSPYAWLICYTSSPLGWLPLVGYDNPEFDALVFDAWAKEATNPEEARDLWVEAQRILYEDAASVFMLDYPMVAVYSDELVGFEPNPPYPYIVFWYDLRVR